MVNSKVKLIISLTAAILINLTILLFTIQNYSININENIFENITEVAASRENKETVVMNKTYFYKAYKYKIPTANSIAINAIECGDSPDYESFFKLNSNYRSRMNEDKIIYNTFFKDKLLDKPGTYVELGAFDGKQESNTRFFDNCLGWKGLLIEGNPHKFDILVKNRPNAHAMSFAPSCNRTGGTVTFSASVFTNAGIKGFAKTYDKKENMQLDVPCGPLSPVLENVFEDEKHVNFFSLDVEGAEMLILNTIDFDKIQIDIMMVEVYNSFCPQNKPCEVRDQVRSKMKTLNYTQYSGLVSASDVYVHPKSPFQRETK